jgi:hypothetical protein
MSCLYYASLFAQNRNKVTDFNIEAFNSLYAKAKV